MIFWVVQAGEPVQGVDGQVRKGRCNLLCEALLARGHEVVWWTENLHHVKKSYRYGGSRTVTLAPRWEVRFVHARPLYRRNVSFRRFLNQRALARAFARESAAASPPQLVLGCLPVPELAERCVRYGQRQEVPVVVDIRDLWPDLYLQALPRWARPWCRPLLFWEFRRVRELTRAATAMTGVSRAYLDWALAYAGRGRRETDSVFPIGFQEPAQSGDTPKTRAELCARYGLREGALLAVYAGVFGATYDLETLLRAARELQARQRLDVQLVLAGSGDKEASLRQAASGFPNVVFTGWLTQDQLRPLLQTADVALSTYAAGAPQSLPNKPFDYMAAGLPQVSSLPGELAEILKDERIGRQYDAGSSESLTDAILWFADHPGERQEMGTRARQLFEKRFSAEVIYPEFAKYLENLAVAPA